MINLLLNQPKNNYLTHGYYAGRLLKARFIPNQRHNGAYQVFKKEPKIPGYSKLGRHPFNIITKEIYDD